MSLFKSQVEPGKKYNPLVAFVVLLAISIGLFIWASAGLEADQELLLHKAQTQGVILSHRFRATGGRGAGEYYYVTYQYEVPNGSGGATVYTREQDVGQERYEQYPDGSTVLITYVSTNPGEAYLGDVNAWMLDSYITFCLPAAFFIAAILAAIEAIRMPRKHEEKERKPPSGYFG